MSLPVARASRRVDVSLPMAGASPQIFWMCFCLWVRHGECLGVSLPMTGASLPMAGASIESVWMCPCQKWAAPPRRRASFETSNCQKWSGAVVFVNILTWKWASRHSGVPVLKLPTSKSALELVGFLTFWLGNGLRTTAACHFSNFQIPKVAWNCRSFNF